MASKISSNLPIYIKRMIKLRELNSLELVKKEIYPVPLSGGLRKIVKEDILLVGDAAHQVEPISGAGIHLAILNGLLLGKIISKALERWKDRHKIFMLYQKCWNNIYRRELMLQKILVKILLRQGSKITKKEKNLESIIRKFAEILVGKSKTYELIKSWIKSRIIKSTYISRKNLNEFNIH